MRAIYLKSLNDSDELVSITEKDSIHHLAKVLRVKEKEEVLLLNGLGLKIFGVIKSLSKKEIQVEVTKNIFIDKNIEIDLFVGLVKKDAWSELLKKVVELGISRVVPIKSEYSQSYILNEERNEKLLISALEQSNNPHITKIDELIEFEVAVEELKNYEHQFYFSSVKNVEKDRKYSNLNKLALVIGPEGGFSPSEESILENSCDQFINLDLPIMRTPTAVCVGVGYLTNLLMP